MQLSLVTSTLPPCTISAPPSSSATDWTSAEPPEITAWPVATVMAPPFAKLVQPTAPPPRPAVEFTMKLFPSNTKLPPVPSESSMYTAPPKAFELASTIVLLPATVAVPPLI
eukprot:7378306-Prymnesium_polylepis.1